MRIRLLNRTWVCTFEDVTLSNESCITLGIVKGREGKSAYLGSYSTSSLMCFFLKSSASFIIAFPVSTMYEVQTLL